MSLFKRKNLRRQRAASLVEYSLLVAVISLVSIASVRSVGSNVTRPFDDVAHGLTASSNFACVDGSPTYPACLND